MKMYVNGKWTEGEQSTPVFNPYDQSVVDTVPRATAAEVDLAITSAARGAEVMAATTAYERYAILSRAAGLMEERLEDLARTITLEEGKIIFEARSRCSGQSRP